MGYTHYWKQTRWIEIAEWRKILSEIRQIAEFGAKTLGISIGDGTGAEGSEQHPKLSQLAAGSRRQEP